MSQKDDRAFIRKFSGIIIGLIVITAVIIVLAFSHQQAPEPGANPSQLRLTEERIAPVAGVRAGDEGQAALAAEESKVAESKSAAKSMDGQQVFQAVCTACHSAGVAGAPIPGSEDMKKRLAAQGLDGLVDKAIHGLNAMPPKGGRPDLSDDEIRAAVKYMQQ